MYIFSWFDLTESEACGETTLDSNAPLGAPLGRRRRCELNFDSAAIKRNPPPLTRIPQRLHLRVVDRLAHPPGELQPPQPTKAPVE